MKFNKLGVEVANSFQFEHFDIEPDLIVMGKASGGGLPMGIVMGKTPIMDSLDAPAHVFTMSEQFNRMCCRFKNARNF